MEQNDSHSFMMTLFNEIKDEITTQGHQNGRYYTEKQNFNILEYFKSLYPSYINYQALYACIVNVTVLA